MSYEHLLHHGDEDEILLAQLADERGERLHGGGAQLGGFVQAADERVDDERGVRREVKVVCEVVHAFESRLGDLDKINSK